jgi:hypothetical protein
MKSKLFTPFIIIGIAIIVIAVVSWFAFPAWQARPSGFVELLGVVFLGVLSAVKDLLAAIKEIRTIQKNDKSESSADSSSQGVKRVEARGGRSVAIGDSADGAVITTGDNNKVEK